MSSPRSRAARARSATPTRARPASLGIARSRSATRYVAPDGRGRGQGRRRVSTRVDGPRRHDIAIDVDRTPPRRAPTRSSWSSYQIACPKYDDAGQGRPGQGVPDLRRQRGGPAGRGAGGRLRAADRRAAHADRRRRSPTITAGGLTRSTAGESGPSGRLGPPGRRPVHVLRATTTTTEHDRRRDRPAAPRPRRRPAPVGDRVFAGAGPGRRRPDPASSWPASRSS